MNSILIISLTSATGSATTQFLSHRFRLRMLPIRSVGKVTTIEQIRRLATARSQ